MYFSLSDSLKHFWGPKNRFENLVASFWYVKQVTILGIAKGGVQDNVRELGHG